MLCPNCRAGYSPDDLYCRHCGEDLTVSSTSLVPTHANLPTVLQSPQLPRLAAGVGAVAVGVGIELLRRGLLARLTRPARTTKLLPIPSTLSDLKDILLPEGNKPEKLPRGYEIHETVVYLRRVVRREG
jgi:hypothetical protein